MSIMIRGSVSTTPAETDSDGNLTVTLPFNTTTGTQGGGVGKAGFAAMLAESDAGTVILSRTVRQPEVTADFRQRMGIDSIVFQDVFAGAAVNTGLWQQATTANSATVTVTGGFAVLTTGTNANAHAAMKGRPHFQQPATFGLYYEHLVKFSAGNPPVNNTVIEWGAGIIDPTANGAAPTDGAFFRIDASGNLSCRLVQSGVDNPSATTLSFATHIGTAATRHTAIVLHEDQAEFWIDDVLVSTINRAATGSSVVRSWSLPLFQRAYANGIAPASSVIVQFSVATVGQADANMGRTWNEIQAKSGKGAYQGPTAGTIGTTAQITNNTNPAAATPTNTTAALGVGLGGIFLANAQAAVATDFVISSYAVPAATAAAPGNNLVIHGVKIDTVNTGAVVATTPTTIAYFLCFGHTNVNLGGTGEAATTKAARRVPLGTVTFPVGAVIGAMPTNGDVERNWKVPKVAYPGEFVAVVARFVAGTATASQVINHYIDIDAAWD